MDSRVIAAGVIGLVIGVGVFYGLGLGGVLPALVTTTTTRTSVTTVTAVRLLSLNYNYSAFENNSKTEVSLETSALKNGFAIGFFDHDLIRTYIK